MTYRPDNKIRKSDMQHIKIEYSEKDNYFYLGNYFPKRKNSRDKFSNLIIQYKKGNNFAIKYFENKIVNIIFNYFWFCDLIIPVPASSSMLDVYPNKIICMSLNALNIIKYKDDILKKTKGYTPSHITNRRNKADIANSVKIINEGYIKNKKIILFDDIITTGNTSSIIRNMLFSKGANSVIMLFIGRTVN
jgi:predicted amidophosphoribosyltransferase